MRGLAVEVDADCATTMLVIGLQEVNELRVS